MAANGRPTPGSATARFAAFEEALQLDAAEQRVLSASGRVFPQIASPAARDRK
jgi:hypothetical protein